MKKSISEKLMELKNYNFFLVLTHDVFKTSIGEELNWKIYRNKDIYSADCLKKLMYEYKIIHVFGFDDYYDIEKIYQKNKINLLDFNFNNRHLKAYKDGFFKIENNSLISHSAYMQSLLKTEKKKVNDQLVLSSKNYKFIN